MKPLGWIVALGLVLGGVFAGWTQQQTNARLRDELGALRAEVQQLTRQQEQARRTEIKPASAAMVDQSSAARDADRLELAKLREEMNALKARAQEFARAAAVRPVESTEPMKLVLAADWRNAGRATPSSAAETLLWAATGGDVNVLAAALQLEGSARTKAEELYARMPEATRAEYGSADKLMALFIAKDAAEIGAMQVLTENVRGDDALVRIRLQNAEGKTKEEGFPMRRAADGWRLIVPDKAVEKYARTLAAKGAGK